MTAPSEMPLRQLQHEVARDPGSAAFVTLADLYRVQGRIDAAWRVCTRGLARHPDHVEGHYVLGRIHRDAGSPEKAYDEWDITLALDPSHRAARRAMAFLCLERGDRAEAARHMRLAHEADPDDPRLRRALDTLASQRERRADNAYWEAAGPLIESVLGEFVREARVRQILVIDAAGRIVAERGMAGALDVAAVASLVAGVNAVSHELARMMGQEPFSQLYQGSGERQIFIGPLTTPAGELLLLTIFGSDTTIGLVRVLYKEMANDLSMVEWPDQVESERLEDLDISLRRGLERATLHTEQN